jgi:hypothetical protein
LSALTDKDIIIQDSIKRAKELLQGRTEWTEDEWAELETMMAIGIECMKLCTPSKLREAARRVELRYHLNAPS